MNDPKFVTSPNIFPTFLNTIKTKKNVGWVWLSKNNIKKINGTIENVQKIIAIYDRAKPIIEKSVPLFNNIKTTIKVARAFSGFTNKNIEKAFDSLPDFEKDEIKIETKQNSNKVAKPFYP